MKTIPKKKPLTLVEIILRAIKRTTIFECISPQMCDCHSIHIDLKEGDISNVPYQIIGQSKRHPRIIICLADHGSLTRNDNREVEVVDVLFRDASRSPKNDTLARISFEKTGASIRLATSQVGPWDMGTMPREKIGYLATLFNFANGVTT